VRSAFAIAQPFSPPDQVPNLILVVTFVPVLLIKSLDEQME
jgi:hypothetical protein